MNATAEDRWGRVADDGTVYVRTDEGERAVGSWQVGDPDGALAFFRRKFEAVALEVDLLAARVRSGVLAPDEAAAAVRRERRNVETANAVGDLAGLRRRLDELDAQISERRSERRAERRRQLEEARGAKEAIAVEAEQLSTGEDWRHGVNRFRELLESWKALPRLDKPTDDALWHRFSSARTAYTRRRKHHFAELNARRESAQAEKERLVAEAEALSDSTDWGATAGRFRDLMGRWKAAGPAPRDHEEQLWKRFRSARDRFFGARNAASSEHNAELRANAEAKRALLTEAEALLPISDHRAARESLRPILDRWEQIGHVPRDAVRGIEGRLRRVEDAIRQAEQSEWRSADPERLARARDTVDQLRSSVAALEQRLDRARRSGDGRAVQDAEAALGARRSWLAEAEKTLVELGG